MRFISVAVVINNTLGNAAQTLVTAVFFNILKVDIDNFYIFFGYSMVGWSVFAGLLRVVFGRKPKEELVEVDEYYLT